MRADTCLMSAIACWLPLLLASLFTLAIACTRCAVLGLEGWAQGIEYA